MDLTIFLAQVMGIYFLVTGVSALLNPEKTRKAISEVGKSYVLPYFDGALALIFGLLVVLTHNSWTNPLTSVVSAIGWLSLVEGVLMMLMPQSSISSFIMSINSKQAMTTIGTIAIIAGAYLTYMGFIA
ncbi:MAG: DUF308 domain-containing protein [Parcubacteria group bacterium]|nr:DUF308 domain-containing protein [Parcubacteria group bacterium]